MVKPRPPQQGEILWLSLDPALGHEQRGRRPVLVASATLFNSHSGFCWVVPVTSQQKGLPSETLLPHGLPVEGALLLSQLRSIDWRARPFSVACLVGADFVDDILARLTAVLEPA